MAGGVSCCSAVLGLADCSSADAAPQHGAAGRHAAGVCPQLVRPGRIAAARFAGLMLRVFAVS